MVIIDLFNRKVVGWSMSDNLTTEQTIVKAWNMAISNNSITEELIFHSDRGAQYASYTFTGMIKNYDRMVKQSMRRKGNCWDNAIAESFFKSLKVEWVYKHKYQYISQAELSIFKCLHINTNTINSILLLSHLSLLFLINCYV